MTRYRNSLPQLEGNLFLTDGGLETTLLYRDRLDLPAYAAFDHFRSVQGREALRRYYRSYAEVARRHGAGLVLESATWRANPDWGAELGYGWGELERVNREAIRMLEEIRGEFEGGADDGNGNGNARGNGGASRNRAGKIAISGCIGPRRDGYDPEFRMTPFEAEAYHGEQVVTFADSAADLVTAHTLSYAEEGIGIARAARKTGIPAVISFTVRCDGALPNGQFLGDAIRQTDGATGGFVSYYVVDCAHPSRFDVAVNGDPWVERVRGFRASAAANCHAGRCEASDLDRGDPEKLGAHYARLVERFPRLNVLGGCCGTDREHIEKIAEACAESFRRETR
jgi:S-methylmethionine-dependent homocysteine/selenocysteine methylase